jgi:hypothetical protein
MAVVAKILGESNAAMDPFKACDGSPRYRLILRLRRPQDRKGQADCSVRDQSIHGDLPIPFPSPD